ncbi:uncharacterized protein LOC113165895 [Anabas testudineus]|uniref:uncharacterized protein LOC113165895 n=1 Tax=Anabas testudineus TaxID=64144 RepID=UPI000E461997|nr:uncharacterized protein LOC113165895 [Anabas testudineus]XP_026221476.1 uncharacterized protein LOC113165895 [Anabas testudineus]XP_026221477.1 uncharacterized protein LOC113165895 [Anabas testudineus]
MRKFNFFPGRISVVFRKGPLGYLRQDPSDAARLIKDNPSLQDRSAPVKEELVRQNALAAVRQRGGDASDKTEVLGEYILQFGKYKGKSFRWLLENDIGYTIYLIKTQQKEEAAGSFKAEGNSKDSLLSFLSYAHSFKEIQSLLNYESTKPVTTAAAASEDDQLVGFGSRMNNTWREIWDSRDDGYAAFILKASCVPGTKMHKLQQYLKKKQCSASVTHPSHTPTEAMVMDEDEELERAMLSISPSKKSAPSSAAAAAAAAPSTTRQPHASGLKRGLLMKLRCFNRQLWDNELLSQTEARLKSFFLVLTTFWSCLCSGVLFAVLVTMN